MVFFKKKNIDKKLLSRLHLCTDYKYNRYLGGNNFFLRQGMYFVSTDALYTLYIADASV